MPKGSNGQERPADVIGAAVMVEKIATGEVGDTRDDPPRVFSEPGREGDRKATPPPAAAGKA